jgi:hypothetical protein
MLCADILDVCWAGPAGRLHRTTALLEDISVHGACLQFEMDVPLGTEVTLQHAQTRMQGTVRYCVYREIGYFVGIEFHEGSEWSRNQFTPEHMLDLEQLVLRSAKRASRRVN